MTQSSSHTSYTSAGKAFAGYLALPARAGAPGILVCHEGAGPSDFIRGRAEALAALGFAAFAPDLFGETFTSREQGGAFIRSLITGGLRARLQDAHRHLKATPGIDGSRTAAIGYCFGGLAALELARSGADISCAVSFHGGLQAPLPAIAVPKSCRILVCTGADDPFINREARSAFEDEMTALGADWQMHVYGGAKHGFAVPGIDPANNPGAAHHASADRRSWQAMRDLFEETWPSARAA